MRMLAAALVAAAATLAPLTAAAGPAPRPDPWSAKYSESVSWSFGRGRLGIEVMSLTPELRSFFSAPPDRGLLVAQVDPGSPAARAGVAVGDVLVSVRGHEVRASSDVLAALGDAPTGSKIELGVVRDHKPLTLSASLADARPATSELEWLHDLLPWFHAAHAAAHAGVSST